MSSERLSKIVLMVLTCVCLLAPSVTRAAILNVPSTYSTIQTAIDASGSGDEIVVADGVYTGSGNRNLNFHGKAITLRSEHGPANCVIDCQGSGRGISFESGEGPSSVVDGITITNAHVTGGYPVGHGGGIRSMNSSPTIANCNFTTNRADHSGGGIGIIGGNPTVSRCLFTGNAGIDGSGISVRLSSQVTITHCIFMDNHSHSTGGDGSGVFSTDNSTTIVNCLFFGNTARSGGAIHSQGSGNLEIISCTIAGNSATLTGGGVYVGSLPLVMSNCILWSNTGSGGSGETAQVNFQSTLPTPMVHHCCVEGWTGSLGGAGNIGDDPLFVDSSAEDYHLLASSPCINSGDSSSVSVGTDLDGNPRIVGGVVDMGAYESPSSGNVAPTAEAGANVVINSADQSLTTIQGTASDPDSEVLQYRWLEGDVELAALANVVDGAAPLNLGVVPTLPLGDHVLILEVSDGTVTTTDTMTLTLLNTPPVGVLNPASLTVEVGSPFTIHATAADFDGDVLAFLWVKGADVLGSGGVDAPDDGSPVAVADLVIGANDPRFDMGVHTVDLVLDDPANGPVTTTATVTVEDSTVPTLAPVSSESILWPPNHELRPVTITANASDNGGGVTLTASVQSNEPQEDGGDGSTDQDWTTPAIDNLAGTINLDLRAERSGSGEGRVYTITITATDQSGNASVATVEVRVPHDRKNK